MRVAGVKVAMLVVGNVPTSILPPLSKQASKKMRRGVTEL
jgi:hypothetical protein